MKISKKDFNKLCNILNNLHKGVEFILRKDISVARISDQATTSLHFTRAVDSKILYEIEKEIGSDLCYLYNSEKLLRDFVDEEVRKSIKEGLERKDS